MTMFESAAMKHFRWKCAVGGGTSPKPTPEVRMAWDACLMTDTSSQPDIAGQLSHTSIHGRWFLELTDHFGAKWFLNLSYMTF